MFQMEVFLSKSKTGRRVLKCLRRIRKNRIECVLNEEQVCRNSKFVAIKSIRFTMKDVEMLYSNHMPLRVIHVIRDPRGSLYRSGTSPDTFCTTLHNNIVGHRRLKKNNSSFITHIFYEHLAEDPLNVSEYMYNFLGIVITAEMKNHVRDITQSNTSCSEDSLCVRKDSHKASVVWRNIGSYALVTEIQKVCWKTLTELGYRFISNKTMLRDTSIQLTTSLSSL